MTNFQAGLTGVFFALLAVSLGSPAVSAQSDLCAEWNALDKQIRDSRIDRNIAKGKIMALDEALVRTYKDKFTGVKFFFPVKGYSGQDPDCVIKGDYQPALYNFYDGNKHRAHPAYDIFIRDKGEKGIDDRTGKPAEILSMADGVVIAVNKEWDPKSDIRGGKYVWIFNPVLDRYYYYAHLQTVTVNVSDLIEGGQPIGLMGRTGVKAARKESPTHLHFMCLGFNHGWMIPFNTYQELYNSTH